MLNISIDEFCVFETETLQKKKKLLFGHALFALFSKELNQNNLKLKKNSTFQGT